MGANTNAHNTFQTFYENFNWQKVVVFVKIVIVGINAFTSLCINDLLLAQGKTRNVKSTQLAVIDTSALVVLVYWVFPLFSTDCATAFEAEHYKVSLRVKLLTTKQILGLRKNSPKDMMRANGIDRFFLFSQIPSEICGWLTM